MLNSRDQALADQGWAWRIRLTYKEDHVRFGRHVQAGDLALEILHQDDHGKDTEVRAAEARGDVDIEIIQLKEEV